MPDWFFMTFTTVNLTAVIGAEIKSDHETLLSGAAPSKLRELFGHGGVRIFRRLGLDRRRRSGCTHLAFPYASESPRLCTALR